MSHRIRNPRISTITAIRDLQIKSGPYKNGFEIAPNGRMNWYFTNIGLNQLLPNMGSWDIQSLVVPYLQLYVDKIKEDFTIDDVDFPFGRADPSNFVLKPSDSDDSYASSFLTLLSNTCFRLGDKSIYDRNQGVIDAIASFNLVRNRKSNGLTSTFQYPRRESYDVAFLMDNCESHQGLRRFGGLTGKPAYESIKTIEDGLKTLFKPESKAFVFSDITPSVGSTFYPDATCQIFPALCGVRSLQPFYTAGWSYLTEKFPLWPACAYDPYPWALIGTVAALRGLKANPLKQAKCIEQIFIQNRALVPINELGFYEATCSAIAR